MKELTQERLKELLNYNPETGEFTWKVSRGLWIQPGETAGCLLKDKGYVSIRINSKDYRAHRLAFLYMMGRLPKKYTDHINHIRNDNSWANLREVTALENNRNIKNVKPSKSGVTSVYYIKLWKKWLANISVKNKTI